MLKLKIIKADEDKYFSSEVYFKDFSDSKAYSVRDIKADKIGKLVTVRGIVTKTTEVKPMIVVATYTCDECGSEVSQPVKKLFYILSIIFIYAVIII